MNPSQDSARDQQGGRASSPSVREIAALTARLRELTRAGRDADPGAREAFLADKHDLLARIDAALDSEDHQTLAGESARRSQRYHDGQRWEHQRARREHEQWWAPTGPDEVTLTRGEVADRLVEHGFTPDQSRAAIARYLDDTSREIGVPVHRWGLDSHDVEAIARTYRPRRDAPPSDVVPAPRTTLDAVRPAPPVADVDVDVDVDVERQEQLIRWHADDQAAEHAERGTDDPVRALDGPGYGEGSSDGAGK